MTENVISDVIIVDMSIYWLLTIILLALMDFYVKRKLGKDTQGFKALRIPKFIALIISSVATIVFITIALVNVPVSQEALTFFGIPYFAVWVFYMCCVFRRLRAER